MSERKQTKERDEALNAAEVITRGCTVPDELMNRLLSAAEAKERERADKAAYSRRKAVRAAAVVAALALGIAVTPLRGYVVSAAKEIYDRFHCWVDDVSHVGTRQNANGCMVEVVEERVDNEFFYITVHENRQEFYKSLNEKADYHYDLGLTEYRGEITDGEGHSVSFATENMIEGQNVMIKDPRYNLFTQYSNEFHYGTRQYRVYLPGLKELMDSDEKTYTCHINITPQVSYWDDDGEWAAETMASFDFWFEIKNTESVRSCRVYDNIGKTYTVGNLTCELQKLYAGQTESNFLVKLTPQGELAGHDLSEMALTGVIYNAPKGKETFPTDGDNYILNDNNFDMSRADLIFKRPTFVCGSPENLHYYNYYSTGLFYQVSEYGGYYYSPMYQSFDSRVFRIGADYYTFLTCDRVNYPTRYDCDSIVRTAENSRFRLLALSYQYDDYGVDYHDSGDLYLDFDPAHDRIGGVTCDETVYTELTKQEVTLGQFRETADDGMVSDIRQTFRAGALSFRTKTFDDWYGDGVIKCKDLRLNGRSAFDDFYYADFSRTSKLRFWENMEYYANADIQSMRYQYCLKEIVFVAEKDGKVIGRSSDVSLDHEYFDGANVSYFSDNFEELPDKLTLVRVEYAVYDSLRDICTQYICYDPDYFDSTGRSKEEIQHAQELAAFDKESFIAVSP